MPDNIVEIKLLTTADVAGAEQTAGAIQSVTEATREGTAAITDYAAAQKEAAAAGPGAITTAAPSTVAYNAQMEAEAKAVVAEKSEEINAAEEKRNALLSTRQAIIELELEAMQAEASGDVARAAALEREVVIQKTALQIRQTTVLSEEESYAIAEQRIAALEVIVATESAQQQLNQEMIATEALQLAQEKEKLALIREQEIASGKLETSLERAALRGVSHNLGLGISHIGGGLVGIGAFLAISEAIGGIAEKWKEMKVAEAEATKELAGILTVGPELEGKLKTPVQNSAEEVKKLTGELDAAATAARKLRQAEDELGDAKLAKQLADIDLDEAKGGVGKEEAQRRRADARLAAEQSKRDREEQENNDRIRDAQEAAQKAVEDQRDRHAAEEKAAQEFREAQQGAPGAPVSAITPEGAAKEIERLRRERRDAGLGLTAPPDEVKKQQKVIDDQIAAVRRLTETYQDLMAAKKASEQADATAAPLIQSAGEVTKELEGKNQVLEEQKGTDAVRNQVEKKKADNEDQKASDKSDLEDADFLRKQKIAEQKKEKERNEKATKEFVAGEMKDFDDQMKDQAKEARKAKEVADELDKWKKAEHDAREKSAAEEVDRKQPHLSENGRRKAIDRQVDREEHPHGPGVSDSPSEDLQNLKGNKPRSDLDHRPAGDHNVTPPSGFDSSFPSQHHEAATTQKSAADSQVEAAKLQQQAANTAKTAAAAQSAAAQQQVEVANAQAAANDAVAGALAAQKASIDRLNSIVSNSGSYG